MPWHDEDFLLLPGDGCLLVDEDRDVIHVDRFARVLVPDCPEVGATLGAQWPDVADLLSIHTAAILAGGPVDATVQRAGRLVRVRLFRTDSGWGVGVLAPHADRVGSGPAFALYDQVLRSVNETVMVTTAEPIDRPGPIIVYVNDAFLRDSGYERFEVLGRSPRIMQGEVTSDAARSQFRQILGGWGSGTVVVENVRRDGQPFWVEIDVAPIADASGWYTHWVSVQQDVTARVGDEVDRAAREAMVQAILDSLPSQSAMLDVSGAILATNAAWSDVWKDHGQGPEPDWHSVNYLEVCLRSAGQAGQEGEDAARAAEGIRAVLEGERPSFGMDYAIATDAGRRWYHLTAMPLRGRDGVIVTHVDTTRRREVEEELDYQALHDALTGLANRDALLSEVRAWRNGDIPFAVVLIDLDAFKTLNDAYGHGYGDRILEVVGQRLAGLVGPEDVVARLGGDEFAMVIRGAQEDWDPEPVCRAIRGCLAEPIDVGIAAIRLSASIGVVISPPHRGGEDAILRDADTAMYVSKTEGRDRWTLFAEDQRTLARARAVSHERLAEALTCGEFVLWFQPFIDMASGKTVASEALLRWEHPDDGLLSPAAFLSAIEAGPLIDEVGAWVLDQALAVQARWQKAPGFDAHVMSVNVSPRQLGRGALPSVVMAALERHGVAPRHLGLEVLESDLLTSGDKAEAELRELHDLGVGIAIDDFGTGYSALAYLQTFPVDAVKVDRAFVQGARSPRGARLLRAVGELARAVEAIAVAEGIETPQQLEAVRSAGIAWGQGFLLGRPAPAGPEPVRADPWPGG